MKYQQRVQRYTHKVTFKLRLFKSHKKLKKTGKLKGVIVNSAIANACTGEQGLKDAYDMQAACADMLGTEPDYIAVSSTGVIGECLDMDKIKTGIAQLKEAKAGNGHFEEAILTTDTVIKNTTYSLTIDGKRFSFQVQQRDLV